MNNAFLPSWNKLVSELRGNPRLRYGLFAIMLMVLIEAGLRWSESITAQQTAATRLQTELTTLRSHARDEAALRAALEQARAMGEAMDERLWTVSSEAVGQARLKDWLTELVKSSIADQYTITLAPSREVGKTGPEVGSTTPAAAAAASSAREFRANVSFRFTPRALEGMLIEIEGGEPFAAVETLLVKKPERRVELTVRVLMRIQAVPHA